MFPNEETRSLMTYDEFKAYMLDSISKIFSGSSFEVVAEMTTRPDMEPFEKINVIERIGETSYHNGFSISDRYDDYIEGKPLGEIILECVKSVEGVDEWFKKFDFSKTSDFEQIRDRVIVRPLRFITNRKLLEQHMFRRVGDIALVIYMLLNQSEKIATAKILKSNIEQWNLSEDYIFNHALTNTAKIFEPYIIPMEDIMLGKGIETYPAENKFFMRPEYVHVKSSISAYSVFLNESPNAATAIFIPKALKRLAEILQDDLYISTPFMSFTVVHGKRSISLDELRQMNKKLKLSPLENQSEFLTENVYLYSVKRDELKML